MESIGLFDHPDDPRINCSMDDELFKKEFEWEREEEDIYRRTPEWKEWHAEYEAEWA